jgi:hypothetical protein
MMWTTSCRGTWQTSIQNAKTPFTTAVRTQAVDILVQSECQGGGGGSQQLGADEHLGNDVLDELLCCNYDSSLQGKRNR